MFISPFRHKDYKAQRPMVMSLCKEQYVAYLQKKYPNDPIEKIENYVDKMMSERLKIPSIDLIRHPSPGNTIRETIPLTTHIKRDIRNRIISPSGSVYFLPTEKESFLRITIAGKKAERSKYKKIMLKYKEEGNDLQASIANYLQSNAKITNNSFAGALNSPYNILYDKANFASTTSISRQSVKCGYSHLELLLGGNLLFFSHDDIVSYCLRQIETSNLDEIQRLVTTYALFVPDVDTVCSYFADSIKNYVLHPPYALINEFVSTLSTYERCAVFYNGCFRNLVFRNDKLFRPYFNDLFDVRDARPKETDDVSKIFKIDADILMMVQSLHAEVLGTDTSGKTYTLSKAVELGLDSVKLLWGIAERCMEKISHLDQLFSTFLRTNTDLPKLHEHPAMVRTNTLISDTDSAIFTTQNFVEWYSGKLTFNPDSFAINAFTVFVVVKTLEHRFARLSCGFGMVGKDIYGINMKNEFFMAVLIRTNIKKHYSSLNLYQEGKILPEPKIDLKGVQFRDSKLSATTNKKVNDFIGQLFKDVLSKGTITGKDYLRVVKDFELEIYKDLLEGRRTYLKTDPIKRPEEYKDDPMGTSYFYYDLWQNVFAQDFDDIIIPNKCFVIPLKNDGKCLDDLHWQSVVKEKHPGVYDRLIPYLAQCKANKRKITRIALPPSMASIPELFRPLIDARAIIFTNCQPLYLALKSIGFAYNFAADKFLISDFFESDKDYTIPYQ